MSEQPNAEGARPERKRVWRRVRRIGYLVVALVVLAPVGAFAVVNQAVDVPSPTEISARQEKVVKILYADGTEMTRIAPQGANRELISGEITDVVKYALLAAEQPDYDSSSDLDFGSGIAKQYLRMVTEPDRNAWRARFTELVTARKLSARYGKEPVLRGYLDTVYLGRKAYGFAAAARMYYDKDVRKLTGTEAAMIAGLVRDPDRSEDTAFATARWTAVMDTMAERGWITRDYRDSQRFPAPLPVERTRIDPLEGPRAFIQAQVVRELEGVGIPLDRALLMGITVRTTIDPKAQRAAETAVAEVMAGQPAALRQSLTAVEPTKGAVRAYWAGNDGGGTDFALDTLQHPGTAFTPFALTAALQKGLGLGEKYDGTSPRTFDNRTIRNRGDVATCGKECTLRAATAQDTMTAYFDLVLTEVGTRPVATAARAAGIPATVQIANVRRELLVGADGGAPDATISVGGGDTLIRPFDLAVAYGTFAAEGVHHEPYFVERVETAGDQVVYQHADSARVAFDGDAAKSKAVAGNVTAALRGVPETWKVACANRECAGKPGTFGLADSPTDVSAAWMAGYTPSLAAAVWVGTGTGDVKVVDSTGADVDGAGLPGAVWKRFMDKALEGTPAQTFPVVSPIGLAG
ncbi:transglycosylase domain-containing protein [Umezawaea endophytica]|uniref:Penicillin-binding protein n=1 Tax=Umezawaea endophytica TaxID=1654476 RepID=A0A9X2ZZB7_9PSEU|nr:transglycosylase domain-containing protein [Umezawaea endophytica]MCS7477254.1 penicillin-binding protein [Umezawaea endophytica]